MQQNCKFGEICSCQLVSHSGIQCRAWHIILAKSIS